jgi:hypothetical protein
MGKFQTLKLLGPGMLEICQTTLQTTFVLRILLQSFKKLQKTRFISVFSRFHHKFSMILAFYLPHMEYEGSRFSDGKNEKKLLLIFTFKYFLWLKNMI